MYVWKVRCGAVACGGGRWREVEGGEGRGGEGKGREGEEKGREGEEKGREGKGSFGVGVEGGMDGMEWREIGKGVGEKGECGLKVVVEGDEGRGERGKGKGGRR